MGAKQPCFVAIQATFRITTTDGRKNSAGWSPLLQPLWVHIPAGCLKTNRADNKKIRTRNPMEHEFDVLQR